MSPPNIPSTAEDQLDLLSTYLDELGTYLTSRELFWPIGPAKLKFPKLTIGNLLLAFKTVEAEQSTLDAAQASRLHQIQTRWNQASTRWASAISSKAQREMGARLNLWRAYLTDLAEGRGRNSRFPVEVRNRVIFELLAPLASIDDAAFALQTAMSALDEHMQALTRPAPFQWEDAVRAGFSSESYPSLYRTPAREP